MNLLSREKIKELMEGTTKGGWEWLKEPHIEDYQIRSDNDGEVVCFRVQNRDDADFLVASRDIAATALDALERVEMWKGVVTDIAEQRNAHAETIRHICQTIHQAYGLTNSDVEKKEV